MLASPSSTPSTSTRTYGSTTFLHATRAGLLSRSGRPADALPHYRRALELAPSDAERRFLQGRIDQIVAG